MAKKKRKSSKRKSAYRTMISKRAKCPASIKRVCKTTKRGGQQCKISAGRWTSKYMPAGVAQRKAINLKARLSKKGCSPGFATKLAGYRRKSRR